LQINYQEIEKIQSEMEKQYNNLVSWLFVNDQYSVFNLKKSDLQKKFISASRFNKIEKNLQRITNLHPDWKQDYLHGLPTYYKLFNVQPNKVDSTKIDYIKTILQAYELFPTRHIEEISAILLDKSTEKLYYEFISNIKEIFCNIDDDKFDAVKEHRNKDVMEFTTKIKSKIIQKFYPLFDLVQLSGIPSLYILINIKQPEPTIEIVKEHFEKINHSSKEFENLFEILSQILLNEFVKSYYDLIERRNMTHKNNELLEQQTILVQSLRKLYFIEIDEFYILYNEIITIALTLDLKKIKTITLPIIMEWSQSIEEGKDYFNILGISPDYTSDTIENELRKKFRETERTPEINRAYGVLKNKFKRQDYDWVKKNYQSLKLYLSLIHPITLSEDNKSILESDSLYIKIIKENYLKSKSENDWKKYIQKVNNKVTKSMKNHEKLIDNELEGDFKIFSQLAKQIGGKNLENIFTKFRHEFLDAIMNDDYDDEEEDDYEEYEDDYEEYEDDYEEYEDDYEKEIIIALVNTLYTFLNSTKQISKQDLMNGNRKFDYLPNSINLFFATYIATQLKSLYEKNLSSLNNPRNNNSFILNEIQEKALKLTGKTIFKHLTSIDIKERINEALKLFSLNISNLIDQISLTSISDEKFNKEYKEIIKMQELINSITRMDKKNVVNVFLDKSDYLKDSPFYFKLCDELLKSDTELNKHQLADLVSVDDKKINKYLKKLYNIGLISKEDRKEGVYYYFNKFFEPFYNELREQINGPIKKLQIKNNSTTATTTRQQKNLESYI
jgi:predicted transcriptional regulator